MTVVERTIDPGLIQAHQGACVKVVAHDLPYGDSLHRPHRSQLRLFEDGRELTAGHSLHDVIARRGGGRFSHWGRTLFFSSSDGSDPAVNGRTYRLLWPQTQRGDIPDSEQDLLARVCREIQAGGAPDLDAIGRLTLLPEPAQRGRVYRALADALYVVGDNHLADEQMMRAWRQGERDRDVQTQALRWALRQGDDDRVRSVLYQAAQLAATQGDAAWMVDLILRHHEWLGEVYARTARSFHQDEMMIEPLRQCFAPYRCPPPPRDAGSPLRVGYVLAAEACTTFSSLPEILTDMALGHDPDQVRVRVISQCSAQEVAGNPFFPPLAQRLAQAGIPLDFLPVSDFTDLLANARLIRDMDLDVLVFGNATHWNLLMAGLHPARKVVGMGLGEAELFSSTLFDTTFQMTRGPTRDSFGHATYLFAGSLPNSRFGSDETVADRRELGLGADDMVLLSCARPVKFLEPGYWRVMLRVLAERPQCHLVLIGLSVEQMEQMPEVAAAAQDIRARLHALGWRDHAHQLIGMADLFIDTFPNGGGLSAFEAMHRGIPVLAVRESPLRMFDERTWSPVPEYVTAIAAPPLGDEDAITQAILDLVDQPETRRRLADQAGGELTVIKDPHGSSARLAQAYGRLLEHPAFNPTQDAISGH